MKLDKLFKLLNKFVLFLQYRISLRVIDLEVISIRLKNGNLSPIIVGTWISIFGGRGTCFGENEIYYSVCLMFVEFSRHLSRECHLLGLDYLVALVLDLLDDLGLFFFGVRLYDTNSDGLVSSHLINMYYKFKLFVFTLNK